MKAKLLDNGLLVCPECPGNIDLGYHQDLHRIDSYVVRFDRDRDQLFMIGEPGSETISIRDEYLHCGICGKHFDVPWAENSHEEQNEIAYEGDYLQATKPEKTPAHQCPRCGETKRVDLEEEYEVGRNVLDGGETEQKKPFVIVDDYEEINYDSGGKNQHFYCLACSTKWTAPRNLISRFNDE